jgi:hypothetical protein
VSVQLVLKDRVDEVVSGRAAGAKRDGDLHEPNLRRRQEAAFTGNEGVVPVVSGFDQDGLQDPALLDRVLESTLLDRIDRPARIEALLDHNACQREGVDRRGRDHGGCLAIGHCAFPFE